MSIPNIFDRALVSQRRGRAAARFAEHDFLLTRGTDDIVERLSFINRTFDRIVVIGAHTGDPARRVRAALPKAHVVEVELASRMLALCDGPKMLADEEALPFSPGSFDCVISCLTLQFTNDLPGALWQCQNILKPDGVLLGVMVGGQTLHELADAMLRAEVELTGGGSPRVMPRVDVRELGGLLQRAGFAMPVVDADVLAVTYPSPLHLMRELRGMGASNALSDRSRTPATRGLLMRAAEIYAERYGTGDGRVRATFELLTMTGWAPHPDQPRPLKPGTATHRLADALGTTEQPTGDKPGAASRR